MLSESTLLFCGRQSGDNIASAPSCDHLAASLPRGTHAPTDQKAALCSTAVLTPCPLRPSQARADAIAATRELEARALKARARQHLQERLRGGAAAGPAPCAADDSPCRVADRLYVGANLPTSVSSLSMHARLVCSSVTVWVSSATTQMPLRLRCDACMDRVKHVGIW